MRGVEPIIAAVLVIAISVAGIAIVLQFSQPSITRLNDISLFNEGKSVLSQIDMSVQSIVQEGEGSTRVLHLSISEGSYRIGNNSVIFYMGGNSNLVGNGVSKTEGNLNIFGGTDRITITLQYSSIDIQGTASFTKGSRNLIIRNNGYDGLSGKQNVSISVS
jgi:hypothetical protein